jgi:hypothetical protein
VAPIATGPATPYDRLADTLEGQVRQLFTTGDALAIRPLAAATFEGHVFARIIGEPDAPTTFDEAYWRAPDPAVMPKPAAALLAERVQGKGAVKREGERPDETVHRANADDPYRKPAAVAGVDRAACADRSG